MGKKTMQERLQVYLKGTRKGCIVHKGLTGQLLTDQEKRGSGGIKSSSFAEEEQQTHGRSQSKIIKAGKGCAADS